MPTVLAVVAAAVAAVAATAGDAAKGAEARGRFCGGSWGSSAEAAGCGSSSLALETMAACLLKLAAATAASARKCSGEGARKDASSFRAAQSFSISSKGLCRR